MNILDFANPVSFWWALLALPIAALYILKVRLRRVPATTLLFWNQLYDEKHPRSWWQTLRHWLSLLLQLAFLFLLVAALVDPLWSWQKQTQRRVVLVLDNSASMQAMGAQGLSRLDLAKQTAMGMVRTLRDGDQMAVVAAGGRPQVVWGLTNHQRWLIEAIADLPATDAPSAIDASVALGRRLLTGLEGAGEMILLTDGQSSDLAALLKDASLKIYGVGETQDNTGITRYQVRRSLIDAIGYQVLVDITNFSDAAIDCRLELDLDSELVDVLPLHLEANQTATRIINHTSAIGGRMRAKLDVDDALTIDNSAIAILPTRQPIPVTLVSEGDLFARSVLASIPLVELTVIPEYDAQSSSSQSIYVFDRKVPAILPAGRILVLDPQNDCDLWKIKGSIEQPIVAAVDNESPLTQHVRLDNVIFPDAKQLEFSRGSHALIRDPFDAALLSHIARPSGDVVVLTCSLAKGDLPLRIAFPVLMKNTIEWFLGDSGVLRAAASTGELVSLNLAVTQVDAIGPAQDASAAETNASSTDTVVVVANSQTQPSSFELIAPDGSTTPLATSVGQATIGPLLQTGLWLIRPTSESIKSPSLDSRPASDSNQLDSAALESNESRANADVIEIACNLASYEEGDLRPRYPLESASSDFAVRWLGGRSLWFYLTLMAVGLVAAEWWLYQRRIVG